MTIADIYRAWDRPSYVHGDVPSTHTLTRKFRDGDRTPETVGHVLMKYQPYLQRYANRHFPKKLTKGRRQTVQSRPIQSPHPAPAIPSPAHDPAPNRHNRLQVGSACAGGPFQQTRKKTTNDGKIRSGGACPLTPASSTRPPTFRQAPDRAERGRGAARTGSSPP